MCITRRKAGDKWLNQKTPLKLATTYQHPRVHNYFFKKKRTFKKKDKTKQLNGQVFRLIHSLYCYLYIFNYNNKKKKKIKKEKEKALILAPKFYTCAKSKKEL